MKIIIASEKRWNEKIIKSLSKQDLKNSYILINKKKDLCYEKLREMNPDYIFFPHWSYLIPKSIHEVFNCIVFHMTDLPFGRGGSPLQNLISRGIYETKLSALKVVDELDAGPIYLKERLNLYGRAEEIYLRANQLMITMILNIVNNNIKPLPQKGEPVLFKRRTPKMSDLERIDSITKIFDSIRMLDAEGYPKAYLETEFFRFEFSRAAFNSDETILADVRIIKK